MDDSKTQDFYRQLFDGLCDHLTVVKGYLDLSDRKAQKIFLNELRREIEAMEITIKGGIDETSRWNK